MKKENFPSLTLCIMEIIKVPVRLLMLDKRASVKAFLMKSMRAKKDQATVGICCHFKALRMLSRLGLFTWLKIRLTRLVLCSYRTRSMFMNGLSKTSLIENSCQIKFHIDKLR